MDQLSKEFGMGQASRAGIRYEGPHLGLKIPEGLAATCGLSVLMIDATGLALT